MPIIRVALDTGGGKWEAGTVLCHYDDKQKFNWGDKAHFFLCKVDSLTEQQKEDIRLRKMKIDFTKFLSGDSLTKYQNNKKETLDKMLSRTRNAADAEAWFESNGEKEDFTKIVDTKIADLFSETNSKQHVKEPTEEEIEAGL